MIFVFNAYFNQWNQCFLSGSKGLLYLGGSCISVMSKIKNILTLLDEKTSTSDRNKYTLGVTRVFNPIKKVLSSLSDCTTQEKVFFCSLLQGTQTEEHDATRTVCKLTEQWREVIRREPAAHTRGWIGARGRAQLLPVVLWCVARCGRRCETGR